MVLGITDHFPDKTLGSDVCKQVNLHSALKQAVREGFISHNPMEAVESSKIETQRFHVFTEEVRAFLAATKGHRYEALF